MNLNYVRAVPLEPVRLGGLMCILGKRYGFDKVSSEDGMYVFDRGEDDESGRDRITVTPDRIEMYLRMTNRDNERILKFAYETYRPCQMEVPEESDAEQALQLLGVKI